MKGTHASDSQPQPENGTTSTDSPRNWRKKLQERWTTALGKMKLMPAMLGWESIRRGMKMEDELAHRDALAYHEAIHGERPSSSVDSGEADSMGHMILGDMTTEYHYHEPPTPVLEKKGLGTLAKTVLATGLIGTGFGAGVGIPMVIDALKEKPATVGTVIEEPPIIAPGEIRDWKLGRPIVE